ncbi:MAG: PKD domain-containing protein, partial [Brevefilum sp.]|nr:PKD domain-containing protein [Brevefilum sp.]
YTLSPSKEDGDNDAISAYDASFALQHDVGLIALSGYPAIAADVNKNGQITAMDAYYILQKAAGVITLPFPGAGVAWTFDPAQRTIADLNQHVTGQDFTAILLGDISGNWTDPGEGTKASLIEARAAAANLTIPQMTVLPGESIDVPILLDISDAELFGADLTFTYDPVHVAISEVRLGSLATGWSIASNLSDPGTIRIAIAGATPITTEGQLIVFTLTALGEAGTQSALTLTRGDLNEGGIPSTLTSGSVYIAIPVVSQFSATPTSGNAPLLVTFNNLSTGDWSSISWNFGDGGTSTDENPTHIYATPGSYSVSLTISGPGGTDTETKTNYIQVSTLSISGQVLYWYEDKAVPGTLCTLNGSNTYADTTGENGSFNITSITAGAYTLTPTKENDIHGITAYDAALVLRHAAGLSQLEGHALSAADVNQNGEIGSYDASLILQKSVGLIEAFNGITNVWKFDPVNFTYPNLTENQNNQDFTAILLGDPSGNWTIAEEGLSTGVREGSASLIVQSGILLPGETRDISMDLSITGEDLLAADIIINYDPAVLSVTNVKLGSLVEGWSIAVNLETPGMIRLAIANDNPISNNGQLIVLTIKAIGPSGTETVISLTKGDLNEGSIYTELHSGTIQIPGTPNEPDYQIFLPLILR